MAATYDVLFRNMDNIEIEDVYGFEATGELLTAIDASGKVVGVFPIQALSSVTRTDETDDGDDGETADVIHMDESKPGFKITNHFPAEPTSSQVVTAMNFASHFPPRMQSKVG